MRRSIIIWVLLTALSFIGGWWLGKGSREPVGETVTVRTDTCTIYDTIVREKPVPRLVQTVRTDTVRVITEKHDTVFVALPIERKVYEEDSLYRAVVSGYNASLDEITVWPKTVLVTNEVTRTMTMSRWSVAATVGPSVVITPTGNIYGGIGATVGVSYRF